MSDRVRKWCREQIKCREDNALTWTCCAHLAEGRVRQCHGDPAKVHVTADGYYHLDGCADFEPPGYDYNDPERFGTVPRNPTRAEGQEAKP